MLESFIEFINQKKLAEKDLRILLGVSGGIDSMVMTHLFKIAGFNIAIAHCNFNLRGDESEGDQEFIAGYARNNNINLHIKRFDTLSHARERGISVQMAARELRYSWFDSLADETGFDAVAIAHNKNDVAETFLINLIRGTGIRGLTGISAKTGKIIRPLLFAERKEISGYAVLNNIRFREDSSNASMKYKRNYIRHSIIPMFEEMSPSFISTVETVTQNLDQVGRVYLSAVEKEFSRIWKRTGSDFHAEIKELKLLDPLPAYLYEFIKRWNFTGELTNGIISSFDSPPGRKFLSPTHRLIKDREHLIVTPLKTEGLKKYYIEEGTTRLTDPVSLKLTIIQRVKEFHISTDRRIAYLDLNTLSFPLILRKWHQGDYFQPLGMNGLKKVSDFFIDNKFSLIEKENTWILVSGNRVVWIAGHRIDHRFRITERTTEIFKIEMI